MAEVDQVPAGFSYLFVGTRELLLPTAVVHQLFKERDLARARELAETESNEANSDSEEDAADGPPDPPLSEDSYQVYSDCELTAFTQRVELLKEADNKGRIRKIATKLKSLGTHRSVTKPQTLEAVQALSSVYPNFEAVIGLVYRRLVLAQAAGTPARIPPLLLWGAPGLGKTHFAGVLGNVLRAPTRTVNFDAGAENSVLIGLDKQWASTQHGVLFDMICLGAAANPLIVLEEVDKTHTYSDNCPLDALHTLLEPSTAAAVRDLSLEFSFDASLTTYVATANDLTKVPEPLRSRFEIFHIRFPSAEQAIQIAWQVANATIAKVAPMGFAPADRAIAVAAGHLTPREVGRAVTDGIAVAVLNKRCALRVQDLPADLISDARVPKTWLH